MRVCILSMILALCAPPVLAEWEYNESWVDPVNNFELRTASTTSASGVTLNLYRYPTGRVYALFTLPEGTADFADSGVVGKITPEGFDTKEIELREEPGRFVEFGYSDGRVLRTRLWHGQGEEPTVGTLFNLISAESMTGTFRLSDDSTLDAVWSLDGAGLPVAQALGIKIQGIAAGPDWEGIASRSLLAAMTACQFPKLDMNCVQHVTHCSSKISEDRDLEAFDQCISQPASTD